MNLFNRLFGNADGCLEQVEDALIIDVRTPQEFESGNVPGSINIPLDRIREHVGDIKGKDSHVILCCASGARSGTAASILRGQGVDACNGGSWITVNNIRNN